MHREKFPEKIPFRLTRMMVKAMEVSGIEGNFRWGTGEGGVAGAPAPCRTACRHLLPAQGGRPLACAGPGPAAQAAC